MELHVQRGGEDEREAERLRGSRGRCLGDKMKFKSQAQAPSRKDLAETELSDSSFSPEARGEGGAALKVRLTATSCDSPSFLDPSQDIWGCRVCCSSHRCWKNPSPKPGSRVLRVHEEGCPHG